MSLYEIVKIGHIISATVLFGTGLGIAFFMFRSHFTDDLHEKFYAVRTTVLADYLFTAPAAVIQPLSGLWLVRQGGFNLTDRWVLATLILYAIAGACWLPVVWIQIRLKQLLAESLAGGETLPADYRILFRLWFALGWPAFGALMAVFALMVLKPH